LVTATSTAESK
jgi:hypothetical protein